MNNSTDTATRPPRWLWICAYVLVALAGVVRVAATHRVFSEVLDEPVHIACGYDWLKGVPYTTDPTHPPLERILSAIPALLQHVPISTDSNFIARGNAILYFHDRYVRNLAQARLGNLLFLIIGMVSVAAWTTRLLGRAAGLLAMAIYASIPALLGHAGVATTDMAVAGMFPLTVVLLDRWLDAPTVRRSMALGAAVGFGLISKFSFLVFFPVSVVIIVVLRWWNGRGARRQDPGDGLRRSSAGAAIVVVIAFLILWGGYRFNIGTMGDGNTYATYLAEVMTPGPLHPAARWFAEHVPIPAPLFVDGFAMVRAHDIDGHETYLLGRHSKHGWWYYFPVVFFYKTPIPLMLLSVAGAVALIAAARRARDFRSLAPLLIAVALMLVVMPSSINIGIRHILPIYAPLAVVAAYGCVAAWRLAFDNERGALDTERGAVIVERGRPGRWPDGVPPAEAPAELTGESTAADVTTSEPGRLRASGRDARAPIASHALASYARRSYARAAVVALLAWLFVGVAAAHPDYLAWFNGFAGAHPDEIVVDSNLDWGQDVLRLAAATRKLHIDRIWMLYVGNALLERHGIVGDGIRPWTVAPGWYGLSETALKLNPEARRGAYKWLNAYAMTRVGKSIRLYYVPQCP